MAWKRSTRGATRRLPRSVARKKYTWVSAFQTACEPIVVVPDPPECGYRVKWQLFQPDPLATQIASFALRRVTGSVWVRCGTSVPGDAQAWVLRHMWGMYKYLATAAYPSGATPQPFDNYDYGEVRWRYIRERLVPANAGGATVTGALTMTEAVHQMSQNFALNTQVPARSVQTMCPRVQGTLLSGTGTIDTTECNCTECQEDEYWKTGTGMGFAVAAHDYTGTVANNVNPYQRWVRLNFGWRGNMRLSENEGAAVVTAVGNVADPMNQPETITYIAGVRCLFQQG